MSLTKHNQKVASDGRDIKRKQWEIFDFILARFSAKTKANT